MNRIDVHAHYLPAVDDGCTSLEESLDCLRVLAAAGYSRAFCTPHSGSPTHGDPTPSRVAELVQQLAGHVQAAGIPIVLKPGGELRLSPQIAEVLPKLGIPTYGNAGKYVLADIWEEDWPIWATRAVEWLQKRGCTVIIAHPERMPVLLERPETIADIASLGVLFQGNLGPIGGADSRRIVALAQRYLADGRYFMVGTDTHRIGHIEARLRGLKTVEEIVGAAKLEELTITNPARLWG